MPERVLVKLGGSVITVKSGACRIDLDRIREIAAVFAARPGIVPLVIHGAGSCGHPEAKRAGLDRGLLPGHLAGIRETHRAVRRLNDAVVAALVDAGREAVAVHPLATCTAADGRLVSCDAAPLEMMLANGLIPVLHGDVVMDRTRGASIVSGDQLVAHLAGALAIRRVGLATDVPGVLGEDGRVVPRVGRRSAGTLALGGSRSTDVTGGMKGKIEELLRLADRGTTSDLFHVSRLADFLDGKPHGGTTIGQEP